MTEQLVLLELEAPATTVPLREALEQWAALWSVRLGARIGVVQAEWAGWTLRPGGNDA